MTLTVKQFNELTVTELYEIIKSRAEIFVIEQNIICQDLDDTDYHSLHFFYMDDNRVIAYLRAFYTDESNNEVKLGRVLTLEHKKGLGRKLMQESLKEIKHRMPCRKISMHAQKYAVGFYEKFGFKVTSDDFMEEGIVHVTMELDM